jgi:hypothetical protein
MCAFDSLWRRTQTLHALIAADAEAQAQHRVRHLLLPLRDVRRASRTHPSQAADAFEASVLRQELARAGHAAARCVHGPHC